MTDPTPDEPARDLAELTADDLLPVKVDVLRVVEIGIGLWVIALIITLIVPSLHQADRDWWPWACVAGALLGGIGWAYLRRGRGNAAAA